LMRNFAKVRKIENKKVMFCHNIPLSLSFFFF
jgi:hypothetical protein